MQFVKKRIAYEIIKYNQNAIQILNNTNFFINSIFIKIKLKIELLSDNEII